MDCSLQLLNCCQDGIGKRRMSSTLGKTLITESCFPDMSRCRTLCKKGCSNLRACPQPGPGPRVPNTRPFLVDGEVTVGSAPGAVRAVPPALKQKLKPPKGRARPPGGDSLQKNRRVRKERSRWTPQSKAQSWGVTWAPRSKPTAAPRCGRDCLLPPTKKLRALLCRDQGTAPRRCP